MARKKKEQFPIEGHPWDKESTVWGHEADWRSKEEGDSFEKWRDIVIADYLHNGDLRPLAALLVTGKAPGPGVLRYLAGMMGAPSSNKLLNLPFEMIIKGRKGRKKKDRELKWRDFLLNKQVEKRIKTDEFYDPAILDVAALTGLGEQIVRDAYDKHHPKKEAKKEKA